MKTLKIPINSPKYGTQYMIIDDFMLKYVNCFNLRLSKTTNGFYVNCRNKYEKNAKSFLFHRCFFSPLVKSIDHINGNTLDNRLDNLRIAGYSGNNKNASKRKDWKYSKYKGVSKRNGKWIARLQVDGKRLHIGTFSTEKLAAKAYDEAAKKYHKEFARINGIKT